MLVYPNLKDKQEFSYSRLAPTTFPMLGKKAVDLLKTKAVDMKPAGVMSLDWSSKLSLARRSKIKWLYPTHNPDLDEVFDVVNIFMDSVARQYGFKIKTVDALQLTKYNIGDHFGWHWDNSNPGDRRILSVSIPLQNAKIGGNLKFDCYEPARRGQELTDKIGCGTFFPTFIKHKVTPVLLGERISLVAWAEEQT